MNKTEFKRITDIVRKCINELDEVAAVCTNNNIITIEHLTIGQLTKLSEKAKDLQSRTDQFLKQDLYHVIGMGNLSASQMAVVSKLVRDTTAHRSLIKTLAALPVLPKKLSTSASYKSKVLNCTLTK